MSRLALLVALAAPSLASAGPLVTDTFGGQTDTNTGDQAYKLSTYEITAPSRLDTFAPYLEPQVANAEVQFVVYELTGTTWFGEDEWSLVYDSGPVVIPGGAGFKTSPSVNLELFVNRSYALGIYLLSDDVDYWWADPGDEVVSWGTRYGSLWSSNGTSWWIEDPIGADPDSHGYYQEVTVEVYQDYDGDGFDERRDCDDADPTVFPTGPETCNGLDDDCDGVVDDNVVYVDYFQDSDGDGFGDSAVSENTCDGPPVGFVPDGGDCADGDAGVYPTAAELCDGLDQDCDGDADEGLPFTTWYVDDDGDGFGVDEGAIDTCDPAAPTGYAAVSRDCDDTRAEAYPQAPELCNELDDDCNGQVDDQVVYTDYWADADGDGFGDATKTVNTCEGQPDGYVADATDCDDAAVGIHPGAAEICDGLDDDCDGAPGADEGDTDLDGAFDCADCEPEDAAKNPAATDLCDGVDYNCDGIGPTALECDPFQDESLVAGCACDSAPSASGLAWLAGLALVARRRRR